MGVVEPASASEFLARAEPLLGASEARHNLIYGIAGTMIADPSVYPDHALWIVEEGGVPLAAALRTPPRHVVVADAVDDDAVGRLAAAIADRYPQLPGAVGNVPTIDHFTSAWTASTGILAELTMAQGVFALEQVAPVPAVPGAPRPIRPSDVDTVVEWIGAFEREVVPDEATERDQLIATIERRIADGHVSGLWLWEASGGPVSLSGFGGPTPHGIRIGPVYTPPAHRGRGYATSLVAAQSSWLLAQGRRFCFLYTDLANPTSNDIYRRIGYRQIAEAARISFIGRSGGVG